MTTSNCLVTHILQNTLFYIQHKKERNNTVLEQLEGTFNGIIHPKMTILSSFTHYPFFYVTKYPFWRVFDEYAGHYFLKDNDLKSTFQILSFSQYVIITLLRYVIFNIM